MILSYFAPILKLNKVLFPSMLDVSMVRNPHEMNSHGIQTPMFSHVFPCQTEYFLTFPNWIFSCFPISFHEFSHILSGVFMFETLMGFTLMPHLLLSRYVFSMRI